LLDRAMMVTCPVIPETKRRDEARFWQAFEAAKPRLLGGLLEKVSNAIKNLPNVQLKEKPRMADFASWSVAALGDDFLKAYNQSIAGAVNVVLESSPIVPYIRKLAEQGATWTTKELLKRITEDATESDLKQWGWPKSPEKLAGQLRRLAPALRREGITWDSAGRTNRSRSYLLRVCPKPSPPSQESQPSPREAQPSPQLSHANPLETERRDGRDSRDGSPRTFSTCPEHGHHDQWFWNDFTEKPMCGKCYSKPPKVEWMAEDFNVSSGESGAVEERI
jgi:hypothetical protein